jgi:hypothetical protein
MNRPCRRRCTCGAEWGERRRPEGAIGGDGTMMPQHDARGLRSEGGAAPVRER